MKKKVIDFLNKHSSNVPSLFIDKVLFRKNNKNWLDYSKWVAIKIIATLEYNNMSVSEFAEYIGVDENDAKKMISGNYNFTLKDLTRIEDLLGVNLLLYE